MTHIIGSSRVRIIDIKNLYLTPEQIEEEKRKIEEQRKEEEKEQPKSPIITQPKNTKKIRNYIYVPSLGLYISKNKVIYQKNWEQCQEALHANNERMPTIYEFSEFLKYLKSSPQGIQNANSVEVRDILNDILLIGSPYRSEWLDAEFISKRKMYLNYYTFENGKIIIKTEQLEDCVMQDNNIDLDSWLNNKTQQGLPNKNAHIGKNYFYYPKDTGMARFETKSNKSILDCASFRYFDDYRLGVRSVKQGDII